jgi:glutathionyl-hydroquinone reductase
MIYYLDQATYHILLIYDGSILWTTFINFGTVYFGHLDCYRSNQFLT